MALSQLYDTHCQLDPFFLLQPYFIKNPSDDLSVQSDATLITCTSTDDESVNDDTVPPPSLSQSNHSESILHRHDATVLAPSPVSLHHTPWFMGTLDFYFPPQLRVTNTETNAMTDTSSSILPMDLVAPTTNNTSTPIEVQHSQRFHQQQLDTTS